MASEQRFAFVPPEETTLAGKARVTQKIYNSWQQGLGGREQSWRERSGWDVQDLLWGRTEDEDKRETARSKDSYVIWRGFRRLFTKFRDGQNLSANRNLAEVWQFLVWIKWGNIILWEHQPFLYPQWACETCFDWFNLSYRSKEEALRLPENWTQYCSSFTFFFVLEEVQEKNVLDEERKSNSI